MIFNPRISKVNTIIRNQQLVNTKKTRDLTESENYYLNIIKKEKQKHLFTKSIKQKKFVHRRDQN